MLFTLAKVIIRMLNPIRNAAWRVVMNHNHKDPAGVAVFCVDMLNKPGMEVRKVPDNAPRHEHPSEGFLN